MDFSFLNLRKMTSYATIRASRVKIVIFNLIIPSLACRECLFVRLTVTTRPIQVFTRTRVVKTGIQDFAKLTSPKSNFARKNGNIAFSPPFEMLAKSNWRSPTLTPKSLRLSGFKFENVTHLQRTILECKLGTIGDFILTQII